MCCGIRYGARRLPQNLGGFGDKILHRAGVSRILDQAALAGWIRLPAVWHAFILDDKAEPAGVCKMPVPGISHRRHHFSRYAEAADAVVPGDLVGNHAEEWSQCRGRTANLRTGQLHNGLDLVA